MSKAEDRDKPNVLHRGKAKRAFLYRQLADRIRTELDDGVYDPGDRLPSMDELAAVHDVNKVTVIKALGVLRDEGRIYSISAQGTYVSDTPPPPTPTRAPSPVAIGLVSHALHPKVFGPYHSEIIAGINDRISRSNAHLVLLPCGHIEPQAGIFDLVTQTPLQGAIYLGPFNAGVLRRLVEKGPPAVLIDANLRGRGTDSILVDNRDGGEQALQHLLSLGHRRVAFITGPADDPAAIDRAAGAKTACAGADIDFDRLPSAQGHWDRNGGFKAMVELLATPPLPTAVVCQNDEMAVGAMQAIRAQTGLSIPEDISVIGFDDIPWAAASHPPLTTLYVDKHLMGALAVDRLFARLDNPDAASLSTVISPQLVVRGSTAPISP